MRVDGEGEGERMDLYVPISKGKPILRSRRAALQGPARVTAGTVSDERFKFRV